MVWWYLRKENNIGKEASLDEDGGCSPKIWLWTQRSSFTSTKHKHRTTPLSFARSFSSPVLDSLPIWISEHVCNTFVSSQPLSHVKQIAVVVTTVSTVLMVSSCCLLWQWVPGRCQWSCYNITAAEHYSFHIGFLRFWTFWRRACYSRMEWGEFSYVVSVSSWLLLVKFCPSV